MSERVSERSEHKTSRARTRTYSPVRSRSAGRPACWLPWPSLALPIVSLRSDRDEWQPSAMGGGGGDVDQLQNRMDCFRPHPLTHSLTHCCSCSRALAFFLPFLRILSSFLPDCSLVTLRGEHTEGQGRARQRGPERAWKRS